MKQQLMDKASNLYSKLKKTFKDVGDKAKAKAKDGRSSFKSYIEQHTHSAPVKTEEHPGGDRALERLQSDQDVAPETDFYDESELVHTFESNESENIPVDDAFVSVTAPTQTPETKAPKFKLGVIEDEAEEDVVDARHIIGSSHASHSSKNISVSGSTYTDQVKIVKTATGSVPRIYADFASLTPIDARVKKVMIDAMDEYPANPSSLYGEGVKAKQALERARTSVATFFAVQPSEIIFTSGGTESNNLAFKGVIEFCEQQIREAGIEGVNKAPLKETERPHIIISTIEHPSIVEIALDLMQKGYSVSFIPVNAEGLVDPKDIKKALTPETVLVSVMYANNEIGTVQPIKEITREVRHFKKSLNRQPGDYPYVHTDACQAVLYEDMRVPTLNVDLMTVDGGKIYGPRSSGVLVKRKYVQMNTVMHGGGQELGLRAGTENVYSILGLKHALDIAHNHKDEEVTRLSNLTETLRETILSRLADVYPGVSVNGDLEHRLPNNLNICFPGLDAEFMVIRLDVLGVMVSSVTSCRASAEDSSSYVIEALGKSNCSQSSLRISLGRSTSTLDVAHIAERIIQVVQEQISAKK